MRQASTPAPERENSQLTPLIRTPTFVQVPLLTLHGQNCAVRCHRSRVLAVVLDGHGQSASHGGSRRRFEANGPSESAAVELKSVSKIVKK